MAYVYASLIIKGKKTIDQVPASIRDKVRAILIEEGYGHLLEEPETTEGSENTKNTEFTEAIPTKIN